VGRDVKHTGTFYQDRGSAHNHCPRKKDRTARETPDRLALAAAEPDGTQRRPHGGGSQLRLRGRSRKRRRGSAGATFRPRRRNPPPARSAPAPPRASSPTSTSSMSRCCVHPFPRSPRSTRKRWRLLREATRISTATGCSS